MFVPATFDESVTKCAVSTRIPAWRERVFLGFATGHDRERIEEMLRDRRGVCGIATAIAESASSRHDSASKRCVLSCKHRVSGGFQAPFPPGGRDDQAALERSYRSD